MDPTAAVGAPADNSVVASERLHIDVMGAADALLRAFVRIGDKCGWRVVE